MWEPCHVGLESQPLVDSIISRPAVIHDWSGLFLIRSYKCGGNSMIVGPYPHAQHKKADNNL
jgi:hypothetical protein